MKSTNEHVIKEEVLGENSPPLVGLSVGFGAVGTRTLDISYSAGNYFNRKEFESASK